MKGIVVAAALLAGCSNTAWQVSAGRPPPPSAAGIHVDSNSLATVMGAAIIVGTLYEAARYGVDYAGGPSRTPPEMDPGRKVSEQDCTKPLDFTLGNIRCK
jgi:hypothetical protein